MKVHYLYLCEANIKHYRKLCQVFLVEEHDEKKGCCIFINPLSANPANCGIGAYKVKEVLKFELFILEGI